MSSNFVPDRYNDCGQDMGEPESYWKTCPSCGEDNDNGKIYCDVCIHIMLHDDLILKFYAHEIDEDDTDLNKIREIAKKNIDDFLESCKKYDSLNI